MRFPMFATRGALFVASCRDLDSTSPDNRNARCRVSRKVATAAASASSPTVWSSRWSLKRQTLRRRLTLENADGDAVALPGFGHASNGMRTALTMGVPDDLPARVPGEHLSEQLVYVSLTARWPEMLPAGAERQQL